MRRPKREGVDLILRTRFTVLGLVLVLLGLYALATITSLIRAYMAKPDAQNGGIVILSRFVHISYTAALGIAGAAGLLVLVGIFVISIGTRKPTDPQYRPPCDPSPSIDLDLSSMGPCKVLHGRGSKR